MSSSPAITGIGLITPLGDSADTTWASLLAGRCITDHAPVPLEFGPEFPRVCHLAIRAARQALAEAQPSHLENAGLVIGTSKGPVEWWINEASRKQPLHGSGAATMREPSQFPASFGLAQVAADVARALGIQGPRLTICAACASGLHALIRAAIMLRHGEARRVLVVATEASLHPLFIGSFMRLGVLPAAGIGCRPFDNCRDGFLMSEAAAAVLLESPSQADAGIVIDRLALAADATSLTRGDPTAGPLSRLLNQVAGKASVDLVHAHGTGTEFNDPVELAALEHVARAYDRPPVLYSHKGALGHSLGAAGLVSVVINVLCHRHGLVPPNVRTTDPLHTSNVLLNRSNVHRRIDRSLCLASGFGGPLAAVSLKSCRR